MNTQSASFTRVVVVWLALVTWSTAAWADAPPPGSPGEAAALEAVARADALFDAGAMKEALAAYEAVPTRSSVSRFARYKAGWCLVNLGRHAEALARFRALAVEGRSSVVENTRAIAREAAKDCVRVYAMIGAPKDALAFFEEVSPERFLDLTEAVAAAYADSGKLPEAKDTLAALSEAVGGRKALAAEAHRVARYQRLALDVAWRIGDRARMAAAAKPLPERWAAARRTASETWRAKEHEALRSLVVSILRETRREAALAIPREVLKERMAAISGPYLKVFPGDAEALPKPPE